MMRSERSRSRVRCACAAVAVLVLFVASHSYSSVLRVKQDGTGDATTINAGISLAQSGDTILVSSGYYWEMPIYLVGKAVHLISDGGPETTTIRLLRTSPDDVTVIEIRNTTSQSSIVGFTITGASGGFLDMGGGISCTNSAVLIRQNIIRGNWCANGGAIACIGNPSPIIEENLICDNQEWATGTIAVIDCSPVIRNNTIVHNYASDGTSALCIGGSLSFPTITNNIIARNSSSCAECAAISSSTPVEQLVFACNDVWGNVATNYAAGLDQTGVKGNISQDPLFCGAEGSGNYYLQKDSPCAEANVPSHCEGSRIGYYSTKCTVGVKGSSWGEIKSLFKGGLK